MALSTLNLAPGSELSSELVGPVAVFFTHGVSLELWEERGMFSREVRFFEELARELGEVWFFTYGRNDVRYADRLDSRIKIFPKCLPVPDVLYGLLLPFLHWRVLSCANSIRIHQVAGAIPALIAHWLLHKPLIVRAGFQWYSFAKRQGASRLKLATISLVERLTYRSAHAIIHTTQQDADFVRDRYHVDVNKLHIIPNWVDTDLFKPMNVEKQPRTVCYVGRLEEQKNLHALVEAMQDTGARLILYGEGSLRESLETRARDLHVNVEFRGRIANEDLPHALNACELFILPSLYEGNPKVLLEAMACGLPVIGTNVDGIASVIEDGKTGVLCETSPESIRQAITDLLADPTRRARLGAAAREYVLACASLARAIQQELPFYHL